MTKVYVVVANGGEETSFVGTFSSRERAIAEIKEDAAMWITDPVVLPYSDGKDVNENWFSVFERGDEPTEGPATDDHWMILYQISEQEIDEHVEERNSYVI